MAGVVIAVASSTMAIGCAAKEPVVAPSPSSRVVLGRGRLLAGSIKYGLLTSGRGMTREGFAVSSDARFVAFTTYGNDKPTNVFVRDCMTGSLEQVSGLSPIEQGSGVDRRGWGADEPVMTPDGRYAAYLSQSPDPTYDDSEYTVQRVLLRDRQLKITELISTDATPSAARRDTWARIDAVSSDGRYIIYTLGDDRKTTYVRDRIEKVTTSLGDLKNGRGVRLRGFDPRRSSFSCFLAGGQYFTCDSYGRDVSGRRVFVGTLLVDRFTGESELITIGLDGKAPVNSSQSATQALEEPPTAGAVSMSSNGRYIVFASAASNLVHGDTNGAHDIFVFDRVAKVTTRVNVSSDGRECLGGDSYSPSISADGRRVVFASCASGLAGGRVYPRPNNAALADVYLRDLVSSETVRVSEFGAPSDRLGCTSHGPRITEDGRHVVFLSNICLISSGREGSVYDEYDVLTREVAPARAH